MKVARVNLPIRFTDSQQQMSSLFRVAHKPMSNQRATEFNTDNLAFFAVGHASLTAGTFSVFLLLGDTLTASFSFFLELKKCEL